MLTSSAGWNFNATGAGDQPATQHDTQADAMRAYREQVERTNAQLAENEAQQKRPAALLDAQEAQIKRWDKVLSALEKHNKR